MRKILFSAFFGLCFLLSIKSQGIVRGTIVDSMSLEPLVGASIFCINDSIGVTSDISGNFDLSVVSNDVKIKISYVGYEDKILDCCANENLGDIVLTEIVQYLEDITVYSQMVNNQKTPFVSSTVKALEIEEKLGAQELPTILKATPGVHANIQGGGWGDSEIYMRGFDNSHVAVLVNGIPVNDMENGSLYWSNWAGLADVTEQIQTQRGIGANIISSQSVGGAINIITKGISAKRDIVAFYSLGNDGYNKILFSVSSGMLENGWSFSILGSKSWGAGYVIGTDFSVYNYFFNISKRLNDNHQLSITGFGAPQQHYSRSNALTKLEWEKVKDFNLYGKDYTRYNPDYGFDSNGKRKSADFNKYHKPQISLNHIWQIDYKSTLSTSIYASVGYGYSLSGATNSDDYSEYDWYGTDQGKLNTKFRDIDGTFDYAKIENINTTSLTGSQMIMTKLKTNMQWYGFVSTYKSTFYDKLNLVLGVDMRYYRGLHKNVIFDLYGGKYYIDPTRQDISIDNNVLATTEWKQEQLHVGDVVNRDYDGNVLQEGIFAQLEYDGKYISSFVSGAINYTTFWRYDRLFYDASKARSSNKSFFGGAIKAGANYKINRENNLYVNLGYISNVPPFKKGVFMSVNTSNMINDNVRNEKAVTLEIGYKYISNFVQLSVNGYITRFMDKIMSKKGSVGNETQYYVNMSGVSANHMGVEMEARTTPLRWLEFSVMLSLGDWKWNSDSVKGLVYDIHGQAITPQGDITQPGSSNQAWAIINMKGVHVGGSAQTTAAFGVLFMPYSRVKIGVNYILYDRNYAYYSLSGGNLKLGKIMTVNEPWKIPTAGSLDMQASYSFNVRGVDITIAGLVNNVINQRNIEKAWNPSNVLGEINVVNPDDVYFFYSQGRTWNIKLKVQL